MDYAKVKQRMFRQSRREPANIKGFTWDIKPTSMTAEQHRKRIQRSLDRDPRFIIDESI